MNKGLKPLSMITKPAFAGWGARSARLTWKILPE